MSSAAFFNQTIANKIAAGKSPKQASAPASSVIAKIKYDPDTEDLLINFVNGGAYQYADVPESVDDAFEQASSFGKFFNKKIKPNYNYNKA
jgi:hypothetical protein